MAGLRPSPRRSPADLMAQRMALVRLAGVVWISHQQAAGFAPAGFEQGRWPGSDPASNSLIHYHRSKAKRCWRWRPKRSPCSQQAIAGLVSGRPASWPANVLAKRAERLSIACLSRGRRFSCLRQIK